MISSKIADRVLRGAVVSMIGLAVVVAAPYANGGPKEYASFLPWIRAGVEDPSWFTLAGMALTGFLAVYFFSLPPLFAGGFSVALLPIWASIEMGLDPTSHNLWPLEFGIYAFWGFVAFLGARIAVRLRR